MPEDTPVSEESREEVEMQSTTHCPVFSGPNGPHNTSTEAQSSTGMVLAVRTGWKPRNKMKCRNGKRYIIGDSGSGNDLTCWSRLGPKAQSRVYESKRLPIETANGKSVLRHKVSMDVPGFKHYTPWVADDCPDLFSIGKKTQKEGYAFFMLPHWNRALLIPPSRESSLEAWETALNTAMNVVFEEKSCKVINMVLHDYIPYLEVYDPELPEDVDSDFDDPKVAPVQAEARDSEHEQAAVSAHLFHEGGLGREMVEAEEAVRATQEQEADDKRRKAREAKEQEIERDLDREVDVHYDSTCLLYTSPSPRD